MLKLPPRLTQWLATKFSVKAVTLYELGLRDAQDIEIFEAARNNGEGTGYGIHHQYWRLGFGSEAVKAALIAGFEDLGYHRIEAAINLDNYSSIALAQSVGLQKECVRRGFYYENEQWVDHIIYVALPSDLGLAEKPPAIAV